MEDVREPKRCIDYDYIVLTVLEQYSRDSNQ